MTGLWGPRRGVGRRGAALLLAGVLLALLTLPAVALTTVPAHSGDTARTESGVSAPFHE